MYPTCFTAHVCRRCTVCGDRALLTSEGVPQRPPGADQAGECGGGVCQCGGGSTGQVVSVGVGPLVG